MVWPFSSTKPDESTLFNSSYSEKQSTALSDPAVMDLAAPALIEDSASMGGADKSPIFALDQLKQAGVPFEKQLSPYLQMDPSVFRESTPQWV